MWRLIAPSAACAAARPALASGGAAPAAAFPFFFAFFASAFASAAAAFAFAFASSFAFALRSEAGPSQSALARPMMSHSSVSAFAYRGGRGGAERV